jgi:selenophosphate synthetase-related protein
MKKKTRSILEQYSRARLNVSRLSIEQSQVRDLTILPLDDDLRLVVAVDSDGAIGPKPGDMVHVTGKEAGRFAVRVPLMEVLASGAVPIAAFDSLAVEMDPTGKTIIEGIREELCSAGLSESFPLSGSTEDNVPTTQTGIGVTVLGIVRSKDFRPGTSKAGDTLLCLGIPKSGPADTVGTGDPSLATGETVMKVRRIRGVHDILPVGSKGILYEAGQLAETAGLALHMKSQGPLDLKKSAGPSTCILVSIRPNSVQLIESAFTIPIHRLGSLEKA